MNAQKTLLATLAGFVGLFGLGYIIYVLVFPGISITTGDLQEATARNYFPGIILFEILYGLLLTIIFQQWAGIKTFNGGLKAGAVIGLLLGLCMGLWLFSTTTLYSINIVWWYGITFPIRFAVAGGLIGIILGRSK